MRYGKGPGGIKGITLKPSSLKKWALCLHTCIQLAKDVTDMKETYVKDETQHKEENQGRIKSDTEDRNKIRDKLLLCIDPLDPNNHPKSSIINIATGRIGPETVNVNDAVKQGRKLMQAFESSWPDGFYSSLSSKIVTMNIINRKVRIDDKTSFDTDLIYNRMMGLRGSRDISTKNMFSYELAPVPTSMFEDDGQMRTSKNKSDLKRKLQIEIPTRKTGIPDVVILDGCAILWIINWPSNATVLSYCKSVSEYIQRKLEQSDVFLVFDRYFDFSIKSATRSYRGKKATRHHILTLNSPLSPQDAVLNVYQNKVQLINMICQQVIDDCTQQKNNRMLVVKGSDFIPVEVLGGKSCARDDLRTTQEEADVIMVQQMLLLAFAGAPRIRIVSDDTDVFILLLHFYYTYNLSCTLTMESTTNSKRTVVDIGESVKEHQEVMHSILACHALSGCDTVAKLSGIGKVTALNTLKKTNSRLFNIGDTAADFKDISEEATTFVSTFYGVKNKEFNNMSDVRFHVWSVKVGRNTTVSPKLQALPPTTEAFLENVKRAHLQLAIWLSADTSDPPNLNPEEYGWIRDGPSKCLLPVLLPPGTAAAPNEVLKMIRCGCESEQPCSTLRCRCASAHLPCTIFCACKESACHSHLTRRFTTNDDDEHFVA